MPGGLNYTQQNQNSTATDGSFGQRSVRFASAAQTNQNQQNNAPQFPLVVQQQNVVHTAPAVTHGNGGGGDHLSTTLPAASGTENSNNNNSEMVSFINYIIESYNRKKFIFFSLNFQYNI
jgi:phosphoketolase